MSFPSRMFLMSCALALSGLPHLAAQSFEVFGGYTLGSVKPQETMDRTTTSGWNTTITAYPFSRLGITADVAGSYATVTPSNIGSEINASQYSFMAGPQIRVFRKERFETSVRAIFGSARRDYGAVGEESSFAALFGSNFDFNITKKIALRFSPGMYLTQFSNETQREFRFSVGPVFRLGGGER